jgi:hypothetical protein
MAEDPDVPDGESDDVPEPRRSRRGIAAVALFLFVLVLLGVITVEFKPVSPSRF